MNFTCLILGILFAAAGVFFYSGRAVNHITAWKSMSEDEKRKIRIGPLCRNAVSYTHLDVYKRQAPYQQT